MKASTIFCALLAMAVGAQFVSARIEGNVTPSKPEAEEIYLEENKPISGMFFSLEYVVEEYERGDMCCILYDDADANMFNVEIVVDSATYQSVIASIKSGKELVGSLELNDSLSCDTQQVFTFVQDEEIF